MSVPSDPSQKTELFTNLLIANRERIFAFIFALTHNRDAAHDVFQEVSTVLWRKFDNFDPETDFACWAMAIARLSVFEWRRSTKKLPQILTDEQLGRLADAATAIVSEHDERVAALRGCLEMASKRDRDLLLQHYDHDRSVSVIAEESGVSRMAIYKRMNRIHARLLSCVRGKLGLEAAP